MAPTPCRVQSLVPQAESETAGTIGIERSADGESIRVVTTSPALAVAATLSRDEAFALLLSGAEALGMVLLNPRDAARRRAASQKRGR